MTKEEKKRKGTAAPDAPAPAAPPAEGGDRAAEEPGAVAEESRLAAALAERDDFKDRWLRAEAEVANARRRAAREIEDAARQARERLLGEVLRLADDLERALDAAEQTETAGPIHQGVRLVHGRVRDILRAHGVEVVDPLGKPFDPHEAEAMMASDSPEHVPGTVIAVIEKGYRIGDRLLRPAKVAVARARDEGGETQA